MILADLFIDIPCAVIVLQTFKSDFSQLAKYFWQTARYVLSLSHLTDTEKYPRGRRGSPAKGVVRETVARVQIPLSPPNRVAFEPAALLFVYQRGCLYHHRYKNLYSKTIRFISYAKKRWLRQLYKIAIPLQYYLFSKFCRFGRLSVAQISRKSMRKNITEKLNIF